MPRIARAVLEGHPHHITQRGNYRQVVFESDADREAYLDLLGQYSRKHGMKIWAYCLMSNHIHLVAVPMRDDSLAAALRSVNMRYAQRFNKKRALSGHLWQGRFYSTALDERHLYAAVRYVELNPVRAGLAGQAEEYKWSSARAHVAGAEDSLMSNNCPLTDAIKDWRGYLAEQEEKAVIESIRLSTKTGRPCGSEKFIVDIGQRLRRKLSAMAHGRPRRTNKI